MTVEKNEKFLKDHGIESWGDFNDAPIPYRKCDISEFWRSFSFKTVLDIEYRQAKLEKNRHDSFKIVTFSDAIYIINVEWVYPNKPEWIATCYLVGCDHEYTIKDLGGCDHIATCKKCGYSYGYNSSD